MKLHLLCITGITLSPKQNTKNNNYIKKLYLVKNSNEINGKMEKLVIYLLRFSKLNIKTL